MRLSYCNETLAQEGMSFPEQCATLASLGYTGIEIAPGSLAENPLEVTVRDAEVLREQASAAGLEIIGFHWLLSALEHLSITDPSKHSETVAAITHLIDLNAACGGDVLIHGSPKQREIGVVGATKARRNAVEVFKRVAEHAGAKGATYCVEPLDPSQTVFINTVEEAVEIVDKVGHPNFRTMIDTSSSGVAESISVAELIKLWVGTGYIGHIHLNDTNRGVPGAGSDPFDEILAAIQTSEWRGHLSVEPFVLSGTATETARLAIKTLREIMEPSGGQCAP
ncbi:MULTISPECIES: sugar phosphate isomerase/epimerase family protein [Halocynthiibacter]|uniref:Sugar phosphate isomerase/epimerase n=1 Tax=Halocynthiibacter halioticoli TaxID=2986804 RepID=A0AAE3LUM3_9RHOB|nr:MULTISPECIES: sugar phosphate isomerase/epimerase family protein [Halocynthiibacter]MCV6824805.1 sugar phosphate isomerase/epimerase [Halocynthiibacter halioticoli]MCW4057806.1 sugar phosphate isomerase/epimerase [Halocynthiibacter sp. SDUM655004]